MDDKTKSIVAHLTLIGWVIALVMNQSDKGPNTSFYLRQMLGLVVLGLVGWLLGMTGVPYLSTVFSVLVLIIFKINLKSNIVIMELNLFKVYHFRPHFMEG